MSRFDLRRALTQNWPYKVAAVVLSVLLWLRVSAGQERIEQPVPTQLRIQVADTAWTLLDAPSEVTTTFQGRGGDMFSFLLTRQPSILKIIDSVPDPSMSLPLSVADVQYDRALNVAPTSIDPDEVPVRLARRASRVVPVRVESDARAAAGFYRGQIEADPDSVTLAGPESLVGSIREVFTEPFEVGELTQRVSRQLPVRVPAGVSGVEVSPAMVLVSVDVDTLGTRVFQVSVAVTGPEAAGVEVIPGSVRVEVSGAAREVSSLVASDVLARVQIDEPVVAERTQPILIELPQGLQAFPAVTPARARVRRGTGDDPGPSPPPR